MPGRVGLQQPVVSDTDACGLEKMGRGWSNFQSWPGVFFRAADGAEERRTYARGALVEKDGVAYSAYYPRV